MGVFKDKRKKEGKNSTTMRSVGEGKRALWSKETASKGSSNEHEGIDDKMEGGYPCRM